MNLPKCHQIHGFSRLKNLPPFIPTPVPSRLDVKRDFESGLHFSSLRTENKDARAGVTSASFTLLHETTLSLWSSFHDRTTDSNPAVVSREQPSRDISFTLLGQQNKTFKWKLRQIQKLQFIYKQNNINFYSLQHEQAIENYTWACPHKFKTAHLPCPWEILFTCLET